MAKAKQAKAKPAKPRQRALKVFRTAIGFHDAYVAAPSRKAALEAWGTDKDLFTYGAAELVTDPALMAAPLAAPGAVIKRSRGDLAAQLKAGSSTARREPAKPQAKQEKPSAPPKPRPRPSRSSLDDADAALDTFDAEAAKAEAGLKRREDALRQEREKMEKSRSSARKKLEARRDATRGRYDRAMERWRSQ